jgi:hypothetical protein
VEVLEGKQKGKGGLDGGNGKKEDSADVVGTMRALSSTEEQNAKRAKAVA